MSKGLGKNSQKMVLLLAGGLALGMSRTPRGYFHVLNTIKKDWKYINDQSLKKAIKNLYESKLISIKENKDGTVSVVLSKEGKNVALRYDLDNLKIKAMPIWDKKWRVVLFDIPERHKKAREALRWHLKKMGFFEFQKSVFVHPFKCYTEIEYLTEFYHIRPCVRIMRSDKIDNELHLKKHFNLLD